MDGDTAVGTIGFWGVVRAFFCELFKVVEVSLFWVGTARILEVAVEVAAGTTAFRDYVDMEGGAECVFFVGGHRTEGFIWGF